MEVNPIALRKAKIACNFGLSEYNRVNIILFWKKRQWHLLEPGYLLEIIWYLQKKNMKTHIGL